MKIGSGVELNDGSLVPGLGPTRTAFQGSHRCRHAVKNEKGRRGLIVAVLRVTGCWSERRLRLECSGGTRHSPASRSSSW